MTGYRFEDWYAAENLSSGAGPCLPEQLSGKHKAEKTAGPLFPYAARCMPRMRSHMLIELYMIHWRGRRREERIGVWLEEKLCAGFYAAPIQM